MPKQAEYRITWDATTKQYRLYHLTQFSYPLLSDERLHYWLLKADTFSYCSPTGDTLTLRKEVRIPILKFEKTLQSALHIYGFSTIPARKELILKYRELSKRHHPDMGGVHEDMVAVNLAYDYLKKFVS